MCDCSVSRSVFSLLLLLAITNPRRWSQDKPAIKGLWLNALFLRNLEQQGSPYLQHVCQAGRQSYLNAGVGGFADPQSFLLPVATSRCRCCSGPLACLDMICGHKAQSLSGEVPLVGNVPRGWSRVKGKRPFVLMCLKHGGDEVQN